MKRTMLALLFATLCHVTIGQTLPDFDNISLEKKEDFNATSNNATLESANYLFATPMENDNIGRLKALRYIIRWMSGTPEYNFTLDEHATRFAKKNDDLIGLYMPAMTKYVLENQPDSKDQNKIKLNAVKYIILYAGDSANKVKITSGLRKAMEADKKGQLPAYLKN